MEIDTIYSSPALRATQTAKALCPKKAINQEESLREIDYGKVEGMSYEDLRDNYPELIFAWSKEKILISQVVEKIHYVFLPD